MQKSILFIGGGNMTSCLVGGLVANGHVPKNITVCDRNAHKRESLEQSFGIRTTDDASEDIAHADAVVLSVKPQVMRAACTALAAPLSAAKPVIVSVAAGVTTTSLDSWLGFEHAIVRCMPNIPSMFGVGASGLFANAQADQPQRNLASYIANAVGITEWVEREDLIDAVTALSGSGPAYCFLLLEAMQKQATAFGLEPETASRLATQTLLGAATMARDDERTAAELRTAVTSRGGTTAAALNSFEQAGFQEMVAAAMQAAKDRSEELAKDTGEA